MTEVSSAKNVFCGVAQGPYPCTVLSCTATRDSVFGQKPVIRPPWRSERSGGTAGYCDDLLTVSVASCPLSTHVSLSLRAICPDRAQTRDLPAHPLWGVRDARAVRLWGLRSGVTTCTANQWAAEASKSIGLGGWQAIFVKLQPCDGVPNPASHVCYICVTGCSHCRMDNQADWLLC